MSFCTAINCMDGRVQLPVIHYLMSRLNVRYVDSVTEPGPVKILADQTDAVLLEAIARRVLISTQKHGSRCIAICAHADCTGNPVDEATQKAQLAQAKAYLKTQHPAIEILALWLDINGTVEDV